MTRAVVFIPQARSVAFRLLFLRLWWDGLAPSANMAMLQAAGLLLLMALVGAGLLSSGPPRAHFLNGRTEAACDALHCLNAVLKTGTQLHLFPSKICRI